MLTSRTDPRKATLNWSPCVRSDNRDNIINYGYISKLQELIYLLLLLNQMVLHMYVSGLTFCRVHQKQQLRDEDFLLIS